ncbi:MAG: DUF3857 domain-containing protein [Candidatus Wallbacteria bacterium]|nr:DUF3857 domain-containing protein [Candidatus Wallbacteria bacterium]
MRLTIIFLVLFSLTVLSAGEKAILKTGEELESATYTLEKGKIHPDTGTDLDLNQVKELYFSTVAKEAAGTAEVVQSSEETRKMVEDAYKFAAKYPDAGYITLIDDGLFEYNEDGTNSNTYHALGLIMKETHKGYATGGTYFVDGRDKVELISARTIKKDGTVIPFDPKNVVISKPSSGGDTFTTGTTFIFKLAQVEVGDLIEYTYKETTFKPAKKEFFFPQFTFQGVDPVQLSRCRVVIPEKMEFYYLSKNFPDGKNDPQIETRDGKKIYTWQVNDPPLIVEEPSMPATSDAVAHIYGTIFKDWGVIYDWIQAYYKENCIPSEKLIAFTRDLTKDCKTDEDRIAAIYHWIQQNIRYIIIKGDLSSIFGSYKCDTTFERKFGCCVDKAVLFSGMLNAVGVKSTPVLLNVTDGDDIDPSLPRIYVQHAITCVYLNGKRMILDSTGYNSRYPSFGTFDQGVYCINPLDRELQFIPQENPASTRASYTTIVNLKENGDCRVSWWTRYNGDYETWLRGYWKTVKESEVEQRFQEMVNEISPNSTLIKYKLNNLLDITKAFSIEQEYEITHFPTFASDLVIFTLPGYSMKFPELSLEQRKYDLEYGYPFMKENTFIINVPANMEVLELPKPMHITHKYFTYDAEYSRNKEGKIIFKDCYKRQCRYVRVGEYTEYRKLHKQIEEYTKEKIFLKLSQKGGKS